MCFSFFYNYFPCTKVRKLPIFGAKVQFSGASNVPEVKMHRDILK